MSYKARSGGSWSMIAVVILLGVIGGIIGGAYFFIFADTSEDAASIPDEPPGQSGTQVAADTSSESGDEAPGQNTVFPRLLIPAAGVDQIIVTSRIVDGEWEIRHIRNRIGHLEGTAWLNQNGNIVLAAHVELADGSRGAFARIGEMEVGDDVFISENGTEYRYQVTEIKTVEPDDLSVVRAPEDSHEVVTLITCSDYDFVSNTYEKRVVIVARRLDEG